MLRMIDRLLDRITMYRLVLYYLLGLILAAIGLSVFGVLAFSPWHILLSTIILVVTCWVVNKIFAAILRIPTNPESTHITALILALIITPVGLEGLSIGFLLAAAGLAITSKYLLTIHKQHLFNPAAIAVVLTALGPHQSASWWVGTRSLIPFVLIGGILVVRKLQRGRMVVTFFASALSASIIYTLLTHGSVPTMLHNTLTTSAMFFLGFVMLTEPLTTPPTARKQIWYALLVGLLFPPQAHILHLYATPELALVAGNIFSCLLSPKVKLTPKINQKLKLTPDCVDFVFEPGRQFSYQPGQYMEWTLPHEQMDSRGARRYLTLASSPTESTIRIGVKFYEHGSSFKQTLLALQPHTPIAAAGLAGDFVLPKDQHQKLVFIAGGIGITPYRSMIKYLIDKDERRPVILIYAARTPADFAYRDIFEQAREKLGVQTHYMVSSRSAGLAHPFERHGRITEAMLRSTVPDYLERAFYISGTQSMVAAMKDMLQAMGIPDNQVKRDFFSGYS